jgi:tRNA(Ile)-lysidine synthase
LKISKLRIEEYAQQNSIPYRDDLTNFENDYDRNFIRNEIINRITNNIPRASVGMSNTINILSNEVDLFKSLLNKETNQWVNKISAEIKIGPLSQLVQINGHHSLLFHILNPYDYNNSDINDILQDIHTNGRQFNSHQYSAEIRNDYLLLNDKHSPITSQIEIKSFGNWQNEKGMLTITSTNQVIKSESHNEEYIDASHLKFPLFLRNAEKDDWFCPIGMKGKSKKLNDFFKDQKLSSFQKKSSQVLCDQEKIIWVIGLRLDDRSKIEPNTTLVCKLEWRPS